MIDQSKMLESYRDKKTDFTLRVMNTISLVGESISLINILTTKYHNIVNSLKKCLLPKNVVTGVILQRITAE